MAGEVIGLMAVMLIFGIPIVAIVTTHKRKMMEMHVRLGAGVSENVANELREIKAQVADLRETTTRYDLSFDTALQRLEGRVGTIEGRLNKVEAGAAHDRA